MSQWVVVLAGGVGSRFWPVSTPAQPKQLLPLVTDAPLLKDALDRLAPMVPAARTLVLTNAALVPAVRELAPQLPAENVIAEPRPAGTAAALAWAAHEIVRRDGRDAVMISVHADWAVGDPEEFRATLSRAADAAVGFSSLVTVGIVPTRADTGFGYIEPGAPVDASTRRVARFVEKPSRARAEQMWQRGFLWNSGIFVWRAGDFLDEVRALTPEVSVALAAVEAGSSSLEGFFGGVQTPVSVDVGVLERSGRVLVVPGDFGWDDIGTWGALRRVRAADPAGNAMSGRVHALEAGGNVVHADAGTVVLYGVHDLVVVVRDGLVLVTTVDRSADLKTLLDSLPPELRDR
ncbi:MAG: NTP transferase domain-containing protein [Gemmatimonadaceae bacterium]|nr:NTP transferase domain-containing protein [Gemmatimonadaceae bacterium]